MNCKIIDDDINGILAKTNFSICQNKTFLVSGASGSLAGYMALVLLAWKNKARENNCKVIIICRSIAKVEKLFRKYLDDQDFVIIEQEVEKKVIIDEKIDFIVHAASNSNTSSFVNCPVETATANVIGTYNLLELAKEKKVESFLFFSSGAVYGDTSNMTHDICENEYKSINPFDVVNSYGMSKKMGENLCYSYFSEYSVPIKIVRIAHTYGPLINLKDGHIYSDIVKAVLNKKSIEIRGNGSDKRPFCYITDAVIAFFLILFNGINGEAYNMANNKQLLSISELAYKVADIFGERHIDVHINGSEELLPRNDVSIDTTKLNSLGWNPEIDIATGFMRTVTSFEERGDADGKKRL